MEVDCELKAEELEQVAADVLRRLSPRGLAKNRNSFEDMSRSESISFYVDVKNGDEMRQVKVTLDVNHEVISAREFEEIDESVSIERRILTIVVVILYVCCESAKLTTM